MALTSISWSSFSNLPATAAAASVYKGTSGLSAEPKAADPPWIDAYDAASWSSILHCSHLSLDRKGAAVEVPDFTNGRWKDPNWREGRLPA